MDYLNDLHMITGGVTKKPALRTFNDGSRVLNFTVAVNTGYSNSKKKEWTPRTKYYSVSAWNGKADMLNSRNLNVGDLIMLKGSVEADAYLSKQQEGEIIKTLVFVVDDYNLLRRGRSKETDADESHSAAETVETDEEAEERAIREYNLMAENNVFDLDE